MGGDDFVVIMGTFFIAEENGFWVLGFVSLSFFSKLIISSLISTDHFFSLCFIMFWVLGSMCCFGSFG